MVSANSVAITAFLYAHTRQSAAASLQPLAAKNDAHSHGDHHHDKDKKGNNKFHCVHLLMVYSWPEQQPAFFFTPWSGLVKG